jgi:hypothetical protein
VTRLHDEEAAVGRCVVLALKLLNEGKAAADDVHLFLSLPKKARVCNQQNAPRTSAPPERPGSRDKRGLVPPWATGIDLPWNYAGRDHLGYAARDHEGVDQVLRYELPTLMHHMERWLAPIILAFPKDEDVRSFTLRYRVVHRRAPAPFDGTLHVVVIPPP